jgi:two-component system, NtrC family, sensor kinase
MKKLQYKLVYLLIITSVVPLLILGLVTIFTIQQMAVDGTRQYIKAHLDISLSIYQREVDNLKYVVSDAGRRVSSLMEEEQLDLLRNEFVNYCKKNKLDFFEVTDKGGRIIVSVSNPDAEGTDISTDKYVIRALHFQTSGFTEIMERDELNRLGLVGKAALGIKQEPGRALVLKVSSPVVNRNEMIVGTMLAGDVLNNDTTPGRLLAEIRKESGIDAALFLGSMRVATTVRLPHGTPPLGNALDGAVSRIVLDSGRNYIGSISVAGREYQAGYTPLRNSESTIIGMLGLGVLESQIFALRDQLIGFFAWGVFAAILLSFSFGFWKGEGIVIAVRKLRTGIEAFGRGDLRHRVDIHSGDEMEELADFFNLTMAQLLAARKQLEDCSINIGRLENTVEAAQKKLFECERMAAMGRMATALSHEMRNIFAEISTGIYSLKQKLAGSDPDIIETVNTVGMSLDHAAKALTSVLSFSYPKKSILSTVDLNYLIDDLLSMPTMKEMFRNHKIKVDKSTAGTIPPIIADGLRLRELFMNIVTNGVQAMEQGGRLSVFLESDGGAIRVRITDTGPGITDEAMAQLFTPFFTTKSRGLGLGLCIAKTVAEEHGGTIEVSSKTGKGTTFVISIPVARSSAAA